MNYSMISYILGFVLRIEGIFLLLPFIVGLIYRENKPYAYLIVAVFCYFAGFLMSRKKPKNSELYTREGFISVALSWIVIAVLGAIPFVITGDIPSFTDALFETVSGFTTTGASILSDVEALSHSGLFWRSFTHWIGGMGVFVFMMAILPMLGGSSMNLMKAESPGPSVDKLVPHVKDTAKILYGIYIAITVSEIILLCISGMTLFDSLTTSFGTTGTGGFGIKNDSLGSYSATIQNIVTIFMILSGINYIFYFYILQRKPGQAFKVEEVRWYLFIILASIGIIVFDLRNTYSSVGETIRHASFQVGSVITTTGYSTVDFNQWPQLSKTILITLMFIGACAGSTGGGMKVSRFVILFKTIKKELSMIVHPRAVKKIQMDGHGVAHEVVRSTNVFVAVYFAIFFTSLLLISIDELDFTTNFTSIAATLNNIGPGMELVGPASNYSCFSDFSKYVLIFDMIAGRLELFPVLLLFSPSAWKRR